MEEKAYLLSLSSIDGLGPVRLRRLLDYFSSFKHVWQGSSIDWKKVGIPQEVIGRFHASKKTLLPERYLEEILKQKVDVLTIFEEDYPSLLKNIYNPPLLLFYRGIFPKVTVPAIAVVGTRKMNSYGKFVTQKIVSELVEEGVTIVSGLARGVDTTAHQTALHTQSATIAVLGSGVTKVFPPENQRLAEEIWNGGGVVLSEYPPGSPYFPGNFPARNRIISGLSVGVVVTQADYDSGSLITAKLALEQGREVFAVPGAIDQGLSYGPIELIKQGAKPVLSGKDVLEELGIHGTVIKQVKEMSFTKIQEQIWHALEDGELTIDEMCRAINQPSSVVSAELITLEISGAIRSTGIGSYARNI